jgi:hypothetical protein
VTFNPRPVLLLALLMASSHFLLGSGQYKLRKCKVLILESVKHIRKGNPQVKNKKNHIMNFKAKEKDEKSDCKFAGDSDFTHYS